MGAAAAALARDLGAEVTVADLRPPADAAGMRFLTADLADRAAIDRTLAEAGGRLDAVLNCQGISGAGAGASAETVLAVNLAGVRVNCTSPGSTATAMAREFPAEGVEFTNRPSGRSSVPSEQAWPLVFLASPAASYVNGVNLVVDGGHSAARTLGLLS